jgi:penicillin-binding protein 2
MIELPDDRRPPLTPQLALRFALAMFAIIFFRLWFLQVLSGEAYAHQAQVNRVRDIQIPAPRGQILDQTGAVLVDSKPAIAVQISPPDLPASLQSSVPTIQRALIAHPPRADAVLYNRLARVLGISTKRQTCPVNGYGVLRLSPIACAVAKGYAQQSYANVPIKTDVKNQVLYYLEERQGQFPGVAIQPVQLRTYPLHDVAAQLFGTIGPLSCNAPPGVRATPSNCELKDARFKGLPHNAIVGQSGLEWYYNRYLQGIDGAQKVQIDAFGRFTRSLREVKPTPGHNLKLSLDVGLQKAGELALQQSISSNPPASGGAFVALNPDNGEVYAMGSNPSFDPNIFTKPVTQSQYDTLFGPSRNFPLINRAIQSQGPTGSTFKPITATAALQSGAWSTSSIYDDTGKFCVGSGSAIQCRHNAGGAVDGSLDMVNALRVSSDDFFYNLGQLTNADPTTHPNGGALQQWASLYGIGRQTGIDLGGESIGNLPSPKWRAGRDKLELACERKRHVPSCGIADKRPWSIGDNISLAVGQGDVQVTPLQLAVAYSAIANGGTVVRPHIGLDVQQPDGTVLQRIDPPAARHLPINPLYLETIRAGLHAAAQSPGGTSDDVMGNFPEQVYGKTGTAQYNNQQDYSWYACFVPSTATSKPILVVVWVEQGGFGAAAAAPAARQILSKWFFGNRGSFVVGQSKTL